MTVILLDRIGRLPTGTEAGCLVDAALCIRDDTIAWVGPSRPGPPADLRARVDQVIDVERGLVTAGLIDAHTHPLYAGERFAEIAGRSAGLSYADLGEDAGIAATVGATRAAGWDELEVLVRGRLAAWLAGGTTTVEAKTGYHLEREGEVAATRLLAGLGQQPELPSVSVTFLPAHALPPEAAGGWDGYADEVTGWMGEAAKAGARHCDVFCDRGYFTVAQARRVLAAGKAAGLAPRLHADELAHSGGARLAAEVGAASADHLLHLTEPDARAMAAAGVVATLCPVTALSIGPLPDVRLLREHGVPIALGTDHNPGTSGMTSMSLVVAVAVTALGLSVDEAVMAATRGAARSLGLPDRGIVAPGARADLVWWDADHEGAFAWSWGLRPRQVWRAGQACAASVGVRKGAEGVAGP